MGRQNNSRDVFLQNACRGERKELFGGKSRNQMKPIQSWLMEKSGKKSLNDLSNFSDANWNTREEKC